MFIGHTNITNKITEQEVLKLYGLEKKRVKKTKSFRVIIDHGLNWEDKFKAIKVKVSGGLASFKNLKNIVLQTHLRNVY